MSKFCTQCGTRNDDDAGFCEQCGTALRQPTAPAPTPSTTAPGARKASPARATVPAVRSRTLFIGVAAVVVLGAAAAAAAMFIGGPQAPKQSELDAAGAFWLGVHQPELMESACLSNFNYTADPVLVNSYDGLTRNWLDTHVRAGVYTAPVPIGPYQLRYAHGPQAQKYIRNGRLCLAQSLQVASVAPGDDAAAWNLPADKVPSAVRDVLTQAHVTLRWQGLAAWASWPQVHAMTPGFDAAPQGDQPLVHTSEGWVALGDPAHAMQERKVLLKFMAAAAAGKYGPAIQSTDVQMQRNFGIPLGLGVN